MQYLTDRGAQALDFKQVRLKA